MPVKIRLLLLLTLLQPGLSMGQGEVDLIAVSQLEELNLTIEAERVKLEEIVDRQKLIEQELKELQANLDQLKADEKLIGQELLAVQDERTNAEQSMVAANKKLDRLKILSQERLKILAMYRPSNIMEITLTGGTSAGLEKRAYFMTRIRQFDRALFEEISYLKAQNEIKRHELVRLEKERGLLRDRLVVQRRTVQKKVADQNSLVKTLGIERSQRSQALTKLRAQNLRLETVLASLTGATRTGFSSSIKPVQPKSAPKSDYQSFQGPGLGSPKASLAWPVKGRIITRYNQSIVGPFMDKVRSKGLELSTLAGSEVRGIADGKVAYVGQMPGFKHVVILDHGQRTYSLYGRLESPKLKLGEIIEAGQKIGLTGPLDERKRNFYFEVRDRGEVTDPQKYLVVQN